MTRLSKFLIVALCSFAAALPSNNGLGLSFEQDKPDSALLKLDYGTWRGKFDNVSDVFVFKNVRFAAPPVGKLRWAKPSPPAKIEGIQDGSVGKSCVQYSSMPRLGPGTTAPTVADGEDCLFLDVTVPRKAVENPSAKLPVVVYIFGGAYVVGTKEQRGNAETMVRESGGNIIWVAGNYRLGAYGFLAGTTVEKEAVPNAGFYDQRAVFKWVQKYINLVGGDKKEVTAIGISAGAGSILHHLVFEGGKKDPLFQRAILQSPGFTNYQDRAGQLESNYKRFEEIAGCKGKGVACLRELSEPALRQANTKANSGQRQGSFAFGPSPDGKLIVDTPTLEFAAGHYYKGLKSVISSHVADEGSLFTDRSITTDQAFTTWVGGMYGNNTGSILSSARVNQLYPPVNSTSSPYKTEAQRVTQYVTEWSFTCHNRLIADAYADRVYSVQYNVAPATHGSDQSGTYLNPLSEQYKNLPKAETEARQGFQSLLLSFARSGDPNKFRNKATTIEWPLTTGIKEATLSNVLNIQKLSGSSGMSLISDKLQVKDRCNFFTESQEKFKKTLTV